MVASILPMPQTTLIDFLLFVIDPLEVPSPTVPQCLVLQFPQFGVRCDQECVESAEHLLCPVVAVMVLVVVVEYFVHVPIMVQSRHLHQRVVHEQIGGPFVVLVGLVGNQEVLGVDFEVQGAQEGAGCRGVPLSGLSVAAGLQYFGAHRSGDALSRLAVCWGPVDVAGVHDPDLGIGGVDGVNSAEDLCTNKLVIAVQLDDNVTSAAMLPDCLITIVQGIHSFPHFDDLDPVPECRVVLVVQVVPDGRHGTIIRGIIHQHHPIVPILLPGQRVQVVPVPVLVDYVAARAHYAQGKLAPVVLAHTVPGLVVLQLGS